MQETTMPVSTELPPSTIAAIMEVELEGGKEVEVEEEVEVEVEVEVKVSKVLTHHHRCITV
jgi:hypothetical protein